MELGAGVDDLLLFIEFMFGASNIATSSYDNRKVFQRVPTNQPHVLNCNTVSAFPAMTSHRSHKRTRIHYTFLLLIATLANKPGFIIWIVVGSQSFITRDFLPLHSFNDFFSIHLTAVPTFFMVMIVSETAVDGAMVGLIVVRSLTVDNLSQDFIVYFVLVHFVCFVQSYKFRDLAQDPKYKIFEFCTCLKQEPNNEGFKLCEFFTV